MRSSQQAHLHNGGHHGGHHGEHHGEHHCEHHGEHHGENVRQIWRLEHIRDWLPGILHDLSSNLDRRQQMQRVMRKG